MNIKKEDIKIIEDALQKYELQVEEASKEGLLKSNAVKTYLLHSRNFVRWCRGEFEPGGTNKK
ncbi:MAG: hypothetical protein ACRDCB_08385 [Clostridium sp.]